jgi:hypothetical protein
MKDVGDNADLSLAPNDLELGRPRSVGNKPVLTFWEDCVRLNPSSGFSNQIMKAWLSRASLGRGCLCLQLQAMCLSPKGFMEQWIVTLSLDISIIDLSFQSCSRPSPK